ncbi:MAG: S8 family serine peptidase [Gammaproteobacteria bacterium]|nr:S8 family serine peptidase [Gammaproteobacteria bacterium]
MKNNKPFTPSRCSVALAVALSLGLTSTITRAEGRILEVSPDVPVQAAEAMQTDRIIVQFRDQNNGLATAQNRSRKMQALSVLAAHPLTYGRPMSGKAHVINLPAKMPIENINAIIERLKRDPEVSNAEPDHILQKMMEPADLYYSYQWHYHASAVEPGSVNLPGAWDLTTGDANVVVAVIDTGITPHADLNGRVLPGYDFISHPFISNDGDGRDSNATDPGDWVPQDYCGAGSPARSSSWHGTHVAGTIGAASNNFTGVAGVNWTSKILPVRALGRCGGYSSDIVDGMRWAAGLPVIGVPANPTPAKVLNLSLGGAYTCTSTSIYQTAINEITAAGALVVVAAGNSNMDAAGYTPAGCNGAVTVAANGRSGGKTYYSNWGSKVDIAAPGGESPLNPYGILSLYDTGTTSYQGSNAYAFAGGTSMAAPHVAGIASLIYSLYYQETGTFPSESQVKTNLLSSARPFPSGASCNTSLCGAGIADATRAVTLTSSAPAVNAGPDMTVNGGDQVVLNGTASDDGVITSIVWKQTGGTAVTITNPNALNASFTAPTEDSSLSFQLTVTDDKGISRSDSMVVTVIGVVPVVTNEPPVAMDTSVTVNNTDILNGSLSATDPEGDALQFQIVTMPTQGTLVLTDANTGAFTYTPQSGSTGSDSFAFNVTDGVNTSNTATVSITIASSNTAPVADSARFVTPQDTPLVGYLTASDADGDALTFEVVTQPANGILIITDSSTGAFVYLPNSGASKDGFSFNVSDGSTVSNTVPVSIRVVRVRTKVSRKK